MSAPQIGASFIRFDPGPYSADRCIECGALLESGEEVVVVPNPTSAQDPGWLKHRVCPE